MKGLNQYSHSLDIGVDIQVVNQAGHVKDDEANIMIYHGLNMETPSAATISYNLRLRYKWDYDAVAKSDKKNLEKYFVVFSLTGLQKAEEGKAEDYAHGWYFHPLFKKNQINAGDFQEQIFEGPVQTKVPFNVKKSKKKQDKLEFSIRALNPN